MLIVFVSTVLLLEQESSLWEDLELPGNWYIPPIIFSTTEWEGIGCYEILQLVVLVPPPKKNTGFQYPKDPWDWYIYLY